MSTLPAEIAASRASGQLSTGPKTVVLPSDDAQVYRNHLTSFIGRYDPRTPEEEEIVQELAETKWRLLRIPQLEADLYTLGAVIFASLFEGQHEEIRPGLIRAHTFVSYGKRFDNLYLQESRLGRRYSGLLKRLSEIVRQRRTEEIDYRGAARTAANPNGFEFSNSAAIYPDRPFSSLSPAEKAEIESARAAAKRNRNP